MGGVYGFERGLRTGVLDGFRMMRGVRHDQENQRRYDQQQERLRQQDEIAAEDRERRREREDFAFDETKKTAERRDETYQKAKEQEFIKEAALFLNAYQQEKDPNRQKAMMQQAVERINTSPKILEFLGIGGDTGRFVVGMEYVPEAKGWTVLVHNQNSKSVGPYTVDGGDPKNDVLILPDSIINSFGGIQEKEREFGVAGSKETGYFSYDKGTGQKGAQIVGPVPEEGGGAGVGLGKNAATAYKLADDQLDKLFLAEFQKTLPQDDQSLAWAMVEDPIEGTRVEMSRVIAKMPEDMQKKYSLARQHAEQLMKDGYSPISASQTAFRAVQAEKPIPEKPKPQKSPGWEAVDPKDDATVTQLLEHFKTLPVEEYAEAIREIEQDNPQLILALAKARRSAGVKALPMTPQQNESPARGVGMMDLGGF